MKNKQVNDMVDTVTVAALPVPPFSRRRLGLTLGHKHPSRGRAGGRARRRGPLLAAGRGRRLAAQTAHLDLVLLLVGGDLLRLP